MGEKKTAKTDFLEKAIALSVLSKSMYEEGLLDAKATHHGIQLAEDKFFELFSEYEQSEFNSRLDLYVAEYNGHKFFTLKRF